MQEQPNQPIKKLEQPEKAGGFLRFLLELLVIVVVMLLIRHFLYSPVVIFGHSMEPTFQPMDIVMEDRWHYRVGDPQRGDVVVVQAPDSDSKDYIKRIIGLPGDAIRIEDGQVYINGAAIDEPYLNGQATDSGGGVIERELGPDEYFIMGDNRAPGMSNDSRRFGPVSKESMRGSVVVRILPPWKFRLMERPSYEAH